MGGKSTTLLLGLTALFALPVAGMMLVLFFFAPGATVETAGAACSANSGGDPLPPGGGEGTVRPVKDIRVTDPFGAMRDSGPHSGVDYGYTGMGATIYAFAAGKVVRSGPASGYGNWIVIDHNIRGQKVSTLYGHMKAKDIAVRVGDTVRPGQGIARVGSEGNSSGPHLHFEYYVGGYGSGRAIDPHPYVQAAREPGAQAQGRAVPAAALAQQASADEKKDPLGGFRLPKPDGEGEQGGKAGAIPSNYLTAYKAAGQKYGVPWQLLAGIGWAETRHGTSGEPGVHSGYNTHGCCAGPMQFYANREMAGGTTTWDSYGVDGNGDGVKNVYDIGDAAFAAANYLVASGVKNGPQGVWKALYAYNHLRAYANDVLSYAWQYATGDIVVGPGNGSGQCDPGGGVLIEGGDKSRGTKGGPKNPRTQWPPEKATIDDPTTNGKLTPRMARTLQAIKAQGPSKPVSIGCYRPSDTFPDHPGGYACDLMYTPANKKNSVDGGWVMANWLVANQKTLAVKYVIWQGKIWSAYREPEHWRPYTVSGCPNPSDITVCHYDHVHVTVY